MLPEDVFFKTLTNEELWKRYCGFLDLSVEEFMQIQRALLSEQLALVADSVLGRKILGPRPPRTIEEFRATVPFTTYDDYEPYLGEKREDALAAEAGRSGVTPPAAEGSSSGFPTANASWRRQPVTASRSFFSVPLPGAEKLHSLLVPAC